MTTNGSTRTPFDDDLVPDTGAPRNTQPLPPSQLGAASNLTANAAPGHNTQPLPPRPVAPAPFGAAPAAPPNAAPQPAPLPPDFAAPGLSPRASGSDDTPTTALAAGRLKVPTGTLIGLAMACGALLVILLSVAVRRVAQPDPTTLVPPGEKNALERPAARSPVTAAPVAQAPQTQASPARTPVAAATPEVSISLPDAEESEAARTSRDGSARSNTARSGTAPDLDEPSDSANNDRSDDLTRSAAGEAAPVDEDGASSTRETTRSDSNSSESTQDDSTRDSSTRDSSTRDSSTRDDSTRDSSTQLVEGGSGSRFVHRRAGYSIRPPSDFRLSGSGSRTSWRGPSGARLLVETAAAGGSPRRDWQRLEAALARKYGSSYRSHGIRETTLAGLPASAWEFEITTKTGTTRKIDVAVHHRGKGYAVLASAPANRFEEMRPQLESAVRSFRLSTDAAAPAERGPGSSRRRRKSKRQVRKEKTSEATPDGSGKEGNSSGSGY